ncbi:ArnT family glycosyltransferase [Tautonia marina]|uniref:ArnT family glycosyltransferase n=1 Tax=Tautonia marina TaxID=2653855 RepID=UPI001260F537|nr:hypothetical protein [Tautonia marina]
MRIVIRLLLIGVFLIALVRAGLFLGNAWFTVGNPLDVYHLEAQMVHLAWRVQHDRVMYPEWHNDPHVMNVFGPLYFLLVGGIGRLLDSDLDGLYRIGRLISLGSALLASLIVGVASGSRGGKGAGIFAGLLTLGAAPLYGFGVMVRADLMADTLGIAGFLLAVGRASRWRYALGAFLLVAAIFTKQTMGLYLIAAVLAAMGTGRMRWGLTLAATAGAVTLAIIAAVTLTVEPLFARELFGAAETPILLTDWQRTLSRLWQLGPELPILALVGVVLWTVPRGLPERSLAVLAGVVLTGAIVLAMKSGSDLNYFLGLRLVAAMAGGAVWGWAVSLVRNPGPIRPGTAVLSIVGLVGLGASLLPSLDHSYAQYQSAQSIHGYFSTVGRPVLAQFRQIFELAEDPDIRLLTESGMVAAHQGDRAAFVDPWLFRILVETGKIEPAAIRERLESREYNYIITTKDLYDETDPYDTYGFGLPPELAEAARRNYTFAGVSAGLFLYVPRRSGEPSERE